MDAFERAARAAPVPRSEFFLTHIEGVRRFVRDLDCEPITSEQSRALRLRMSASMAEQEIGFRPNADWQDWYVDMLLAERVPFGRWREAQRRMVGLVLDWRG